MNFLRLCWRLVRQLFHEATGALFAFFAFFGGMNAWRDWRHSVSGWLVALDGGYALTMFVLAMLCYRDSRRVR